MRFGQVGSLGAQNGVLDQLCLDHVIGPADKLLFLDAFVDTLEKFGVEVLATVHATQIICEVIQAHLTIFPEK